MSNSQTITDIERELSLYKNTIGSRVQFYEVDSTGFVNKIRYLYWIEWARTMYYCNMGMKFDSKLFTIEFPQMVVHSEIDFYNNARFLDEYEVLTRIAYIKNSSIGIRNIIKKQDGTILAKASGVSVFLNNVNYQPERVPDNIRLLIKEYEGEGIKFLE